MKKGEIQLTVKDAQAEIDALTAQLAEARAQIAAKDKRIAELEGLLREGMVMIKNADALRAAVNVLAADVLEVRS